LKINLINIVYLLNYIMTELLDSASLLALNNITPITRRKRISAELKLFIDKFKLLLHDDYKNMRKFI
jgi:hypothetical protein